MSASLRFLAVAVAGWAVIRGMTLGVLPGAEAFTVAKAEATPPAIVQTEFPPLPPVQTVQAQVTAAVPGDWGGHPPYAPHVGYEAYPARAPRPLGIPVYYYPATLPAEPLPVRESGYMLALPEPGPQFYSPIPPLDDWPLSRIASAATPDWRGKSTAPAPVSVPQIPSSDRLDRLQLSAWALLRGPLGPGTLASGGTLSGSQAGARLTYAFNPQLAASLRSSSPVGGSRGGEVAAGVRLTPFRSIPVSLTAERRQAVGRYATGRSAFALFLEGGVYQRPLGWNLTLDGYVQAGVVGARRRDLFADGGLAITRPLYDRFSFGMGAWGGYQPGIYRVDAGPRVSMRLRPNIRVHFDWRQRLAGTAEPGSGPAVTLAADF